MTIFLGLIAFWIVAGPALICVAVTLSVLKLSEPEGLLEIIPNGREVLANNPEFKSRHRWAADHGFVPEFLADFRGLGGHRTLLCVWRHPFTGRYFSSQSAPGRLCSQFTSTMEHDVTLTTANSRDALAFPSAPDRYLEAFDRLGLDELQQRHEESLVWLRNTRGLTPIRVEAPVDELILKSFREQIAHVRSLPLWPLRGAWWYWGRRNLLCNKPIAKLHRDRTRPEHRATTNEGAQNE